MDNNGFSLDMVGIRLVKEAPIMSEHRITTPRDAILLVGGMMCEMDRELVSVINLKTDGTPINCSVVSMGALDQAIANPREMLKASILSNAASMIMIHNHRRKGMLTY